MASDFWSLAEQAARVPMAAPRWRQHLAVALRKAAGASFSAVLTCPPGQVMDLQFTVDPPEQSALFGRLVSEFLPRIEQSGEGWERRSLKRNLVYAPLEAAQNARLAESVRSVLQEGSGATSMVTTLLMNDDNQLLGSFVLAGPGEPGEFLSRTKPHLESLAEIAARTLQASMELAMGCGATVTSLPASSSAKLTSRERQVANLVASGLSDTNVASRLGISEQTVGSHLRRIYSKLGIHTRVELTARLIGSTGRTG